MAGTISKTDAKHEAQDLLMSGLQAAMTQAADAGEAPEVLEAMSQQMARVERLFGYTVGSWARGV